MRRSALRLAAAVLSAVVFLSGCAELIDLDKKAMVVGVGLDTAAAPETYTVTVQYLRPSTGTGGGGLLGSGGPGPTSNQAVTLSAAGRDVADAFRHLRDETDRYIYFGNLGVLMVGENLARRGVLAPLDFFLRAGEVAEATQIVVVRGPASGLLANRTRATLGGAALPLFEFLRLAERAHFPTMPNVLWRFLGPLYSHNRAAYAPIFGTSNEGQPFRYLGVALFRRGRMVGQIDGQSSVALDWLVKGNGYPDALVRLPGSSEPVALRVMQVHKRWAVLGPEEAALHMRLNVTVREGNGVVLDGRDLSAIEHPAALQIRDQVRAVLDTLQRDGTDVLNLSDRVFARYRGDAKDWPARFSRMRLRLYVTVRIYEGGRKS